MIRELIIKNFKGILNADITFNADRNVIVGNNGVGKSTIIEALSLVLGYGLNQLEVIPSLFHIKCASQYNTNKIPPEIIIEVYFDDQPNAVGIAELSGYNNTKHEYSFGIQLKISFDEDTYGDLFEQEKAESHQIPCEFYKIERNWFSDTKVIQRLIPYYPLVVDSTSNYFNSSSNQYVANLLQKYIGDAETIKLKTGLRKLKDSFDEDDGLAEINRRIAEKRENLSVSIDVTSNIITRNIICPYLDKIPINQIGAGELCMLKTVLSLDKQHLNDKSKIVIIEEPESHLSHTKMYELIEEIVSNLDGTNTQLFITTHNNFVANKLNLSKLLLLTNEAGIVNATKITDDTELSSFFTKISNYPTLRLILCKAAILVEGPADEMVVTYYYKKKYNRMPFADGIELISVEGIKFKRYVELAQNSHKKVAIITDNDGFETMEELQRQRGLETLSRYAKVFTDSDSNTCTTLEPSFVNANIEDWNSLARIVRKRRAKNDNPENLVRFMVANKTDWAFRLLNSVDTTNFKTPQYIINAVNWVKDEHE